MSDKLPAEQDLSVRNVELHSLGRKEYGTLVLTRHHFVFRYYPDATRDLISATRAQNGPALAPAAASTSAESSTISDASATSSAPRDSEGGHVLVDSKGERAFVNEASVKADVPDGSKLATPKQRQREMWMPYPLVNRCVLRPSHTISHTVRSDSGEATSEDYEDGPNNKDLFPPTYGTSGYTPGRPSTDSAHLAPYSSPARSASPAASRLDVSGPSDTGRQPAIRIRLKDFRMLALHFHPTSSATSADDTAREVFYALRNRCCVDSIRDFHAFRFSPPKEEVTTSGLLYDARREYARMGIGSKVAAGPGTAWRISDINKDYSYSATYPSVLCVPATVSDNMLKYGGTFRSRSRVPCLSYLHFNGGSITRSSQPMVGVQNKRNPQDERLVSAIFSSHTPPQNPAQAGLQHQDTPLDIPSGTNNDPTLLSSESSTLPKSGSETALNEVPEGKSTPLSQKIYGSSRRNLIVDARPKINALANRATGGGIEDVANYRANSDVPVEKVFLNVANIHVMRASLEKVIESFANSDYIKVKPDQEALRKSGWLGHIAGMLEGAEMIARVVGLGGSHVLIHCSDGWDRTAQMSALAQIMLDPHSRTLNGFITLVQKDFLSFGHKFRDRDGIEGSEKWFEIENERVMPSRNRENNNSDPTTLNALGAKAFTGAKNWFEKNRGTIFRQQNSSRENVGDQGSSTNNPSRPPSPPPNSILHSPSTPTGKEEKAHRMSEKEVSPIFHQFLDTVYQLQHQYPRAFEFNEHFLCRLFYHVYSCQYGDFLFNNEKERGESKSPASVWSHFLSRKQDFLNPEYAAQADESLLFPTRSGTDREIDVRWWNRLFRRDDNEMNVPRALVRTEQSGATFDSSASGSFEERVVAKVPAVDATPAAAAANGSIEDAKSNPSLASAENNDLASRVSSMRPDQPTAGASVNSTGIDKSIEQEATTDETSAKVLDGAAESVKVEQPAAPEFEGDPLGVSANVQSSKPQRGGLDFAAFASQNAFRD